MRDGSDQMEIMQKFNRTKVICFCSRLKRRTSVHVTQKESEHFGKMKQPLQMKSI